jgi:hypothetical protein
MKNIHVLKTEKPSRLHLWTDEKGTRPELCELEYSHTRNTQHIYITSDEEIKEGDWYFDGTDLVHKKTKYNDALVDGNKNAKKIILTTDQDLIKDGVKAIDDEFLEWFVKNPSCEFVKVSKIYNSYGEIDIFDLVCTPHSFKYKTIIPKEEPKFEDSIENSVNIMSIANSMFGKKEPKQETLEEVAERWNEKQTTLEFGKPYNAPNRIKAFIEGAKWQQERIGLMEIELRHTKTLLASCEKALEDRDKQDKNKYSEEDVKQAFLDGMFYSSGDTVDNAIKEWFEQFSKLKL